ncbi:MAG: carbohydrate-binding module family 20 domain-containing protein [bacterium]
MSRFASGMLAVALLLAVASTALGAVGWCGNVWPNNGTVYTTNDNIGVYVQIWKEGVTDQAGQGDSLEAYLYYKCHDAGTFTEVAMTYNVDVGNNDEYTSTIPQGHGCDTVEYYVRVLDVTDSTECYGNDQAGNPPNFFLPITLVTSQDVTVRFHLCLTTGVTTSGDVCVTGSAAELTTWGDGVSMIQSCPSLSPGLWQVDVVFLAGSNPYVEYKYKKDDCSTWEGTGNHSFTIDDSGSTQDLVIDGWEWVTPDCPDCPTANEPVQWGTIKALYR